MHSILFTFQKEFPEFLGKWKAPEVFNPLTVVKRIVIIVISLDFHSTKQGLPLVDSWSRDLD